MKPGCLVRISDEFNRRFTPDRHATGVVEKLDENNRVTIKLSNGRIRIIHACWLAVLEESNKETGISEFRPPWTKDFRQLQHVAQ